MKLAYGLLLILAMAVTASATIITSPLDPNYAGTLLIDPTTQAGFVDESYLSDFSGNGLDITVDDGLAQWWDASDDNGVTPAYSALFNYDSNENSTDTITLDFGTPITVFGFYAAPEDTDQEYTITANFYSGTAGGGTLLDTTNQTLMGGYTDVPIGFGFFAAYNSTPYQSVTVSINEPSEDGFIMSDLQGPDLSTPEPSTSLLLGAGLLGLGLVSRRRFA